MSTDHDHHDHDHPGLQPDEEDGELTVYQAMEITLRQLLIEKDVLTEAELRDIHEQMDRRGPHNGARMIARAWTDEAFHELVRTDATAAARQLGMDPTWLHLIVLENTPRLHNLVVCTLCSCYPWPLLGLPPDWYKSRAYRSDAVNKPRQLLQRFGTELADGVEVRVHDSTADMRYLVMPVRPANTEGWTEDQLVELITRDNMIGVTVPISPVQGTPTSGSP